MLTKEIWKLQEKIKKGILKGHIPASQRTVISISMFFPFLLACVLVWFSVDLGVTLCLVFHNPPFSPAEHFLILFVVLK